MWCEKKCLRLFILLKKGTDSHSYLYTEVLGLSPILSNISEFNFYVFGDMDSLPGPTFLSP